MKIKKQSTSVTITFHPKEYWLRRNMNNPDWCGDYCLTGRIDMSYKGKDDQEGGVVIYLTENEVQIFKDAGFSEIMGGDDPTLLDKK